ncbi:MAG: hypothetical protein II476_06255 [Bacteroidales bacterium]|nr:hypothetical protein [Bacteroidales bacterium]
MRAPPAILVRGWTSPREPVQLVCGRCTWRAKELRKSGERRSARRCREERRVSEGRYDDFERSDDGGVKGLS